MLGSPTSHATAALRRLVVARVITSFTTNFAKRREVGFVPRVRVKVTAATWDELSVARVRHRVEHELAPLLGRVTVSVITERGDKSSPPQ